MNWLWQNIDIHKISFHMSGDRNHPDQKQFWSFFILKSTSRKRQYRHVLNVQIFCRQLNIKMNYREISYISGTLAGNKTDDHSAVVGASPVDTAPNKSSFST